MNRSETQERIRGTYVRNRRMLKMRNKGMTYAEIGRMFPLDGESLSRQRVEQIIKRLGGK